MARLPPGQRAGELVRFGLPRFARRSVLSELDPTITVGGAVNRAGTLSVDDVMHSRPRREQVSDLHCVTTWSVVGMLWAGVAFRDVHAHIEQEFGVDPRAEWVTVRGLDGYRACLRLDDLLAVDILLADRLDDVPLTSEFGAPVRLVTPGHYGYKSVRQVCRIDYRAAYDPGSAGWLAHPRGRVAFEERSRVLPGRMWRPVWRAAVRPIRWWFGKAVSHPYRVPAPREDKGAA